MMSRVLLAALLATATAVVQAESRLSAAASGALTTSAKLNVQITVPRILFLQVGATGATVNTLTFGVGTTGFTGALPQTNVVPTGTPPFTSTATTAGDDDGTSDGRITARLWTNNGTATLSCAAAPLVSGANTIALSAIAVSAGTGTLAHPGATLACGAASNTSVGAAGVNDLSSNWTYSYAPAVAPPAGQYTTQVTYTATQP